MKVSKMDTNEQLTEKTISIPDAKVDGLLELYAEKLHDGQKTLAFGIRIAMKYLGIVTDERIQDAIDPVAAKARAKKERKKIEMLKPIESEEKPRKARKIRK
jgi:hypothetical protein